MKYKEWFAMWDITVNHVMDTLDMVIEELGLDTVYSLREMNYQDGNVYIDTARANGTEIVRIVYTIPTKFLDDHETMIKELRDGTWTTWTMDRLTQEEL